MIDDLSLVINGQKYTGWQSVRVTRSCERFPSDFEVTVTQKDPTGKIMPIKPFDVCQVYLGEDLVITGYIDTMTNTLSADSHAVSISGRSKCEDLVDCSAEFPAADSQAYGVPSLSQSSGTAPGLAQLLSQPYGITSSLRSTRTSFTSVPVFRITLGETPYEIIERFARFENLLVYDDADGNLVLADIGYTEMASGFELGTNIQDITLQLAADQRYSEIDVFDQTAYSQGTTSASVPPAIVTDPTIRHRRLMLIAEVGHYINLNPRRAQWEMNRRIGRSQIVHLRTDTWRDQAGTLWQPNAYTMVDAPSLGISHVKWIISEVTYSKDLRGGTVADLTIMSPLAFSIEPKVVQQFDQGLFVGSPET